VARKVIIIADVIVVAAPRVIDASSPARAKSLFHLGHHGVISSPSFIYPVSPKTVELRVGAEQLAAGNRRLMAEVPELCDAIERPGIYSCKAVPVKKKLGSS